MLQLEQAQFHRHLHDECLVQVEHTSLRQILNGEQMARMVRTLLRNLLRQACPEPRLARLANQILSVQEKWIRQPRYKPVVKI
jgi:hypothetical protein